MFGISGSAASPPRLFVLGVFVMVAISMPSAAMSTATCPQCNDTHSCARPDLAYVECPVSTHQCVASFKGCHGSVRMLEAYCEPKAAQVLCSVASDQVCCSDPENAQCRARLMAFLKDNRSCDVVTEPPQRTSPLSSSTNLHKGEHLLCSGFSIFLLHNSHSPSHDCLATRNSELGKGVLVSVTLSLCSGTLCPCLGIEQYRTLDTVCLLAVQCM
eukprot:scpid53268/ scgid1515/ 